MKQLLGLGDVSSVIGVARHRIEYAIANGSIPEPEQRLANKRVFTTEDVQRVAEHFGVKLENGHDAEKGES
ncbi:MAG: hypothetical protein CMJ47_11145 [Planctomyces sp.]|nr:hypothetical protein [Planctomyces sp.]